MNMKDKKLFFLDVCIQDGRNECWSLAADCSECMNMADFLSGPVKKSKKTRDIMRKLDENEK